MPGLPDGMHAWTTTRSMGSFGLASLEPAGDVIARWDALTTALQSHGVERLASAAQVHGAVVATHANGWRGWLRLRGVDGHATATAGTALAVTVADCTPVFMWHPRGAVAALHAGWRGTAGRILGVGLELLAAQGFPAEECSVHLGPSICGSCYEVGPEVLEAVHGRPTKAKGLLDVRAVLAEQAERHRVASLTVSRSCTRCDNERFFSHRAGDWGRQLGLIALQSS